MNSCLQNKYIFFDVDGTLSEYRYNDRLYSGECPEFGCQSLRELLFGDLFFQARPLKTMQKLIEGLEFDKVFILGTVVTNNEVNQKYRWLAKYYPNIKKENIFFVSSTMIKPDVILEFCKYYGIDVSETVFIDDRIDVSETVFIDDRIDVLRKAEALGIKAYHPSSFVE